MKLPHTLFSSVAILFLCAGSASAQISTPPNFSPAVLSIYASPICVQASSNGQQLVLASCAIPTTDSQLLYFDEVLEDGQGTWYQLVFGSSNDCVEVLGGGTSNNVAVVRATCKTYSQDSQLWYFSAAGSSTRVQLVNRNSGKCIDQGDRSSGTALVQSTCLGSSTWLPQVFQTNHPAS